MGSEVRSASVSPANIVGNTLGAAQAVAYAGVQGQTAARLQAAAAKVASGASRVVRINEFMDLYNANMGKGRPRLLSEFMLHEDRDAVFSELAMLKALHAAEPDLLIVPGHDVAAVDALIASGAMTAQFRH